MPWAPPAWDDYIAGIIGPPPNPLANDPEPGEPDTTSYLPPMPETPEAVSELRQQKLDEAFAKGTGPYPEGARTDKARIAQATGPTGTINQIGHDNLSQQQEAPLGWEGLTPLEESQIEVDQPQLLTPPSLVPEQAAPPPAFDIAKPVADAGQKLEGIDGNQLGSFMADQSAEDQQGYRRGVEKKQDDFRLSSVIEANRKSEEAFTAAEQERQRRMASVAQRHAQLDAEAKKLADENPLDQISGTRKILGVIASIFGGFAANKTGRNMGLEIVNSIAEDAAQQQAQKIALNRQQMGALGDERQQSEDEFRQANIVRLAVYDGAIKKMETDVQQLDPKGSQALARLDDINQLRAMRAQAAQKALDADMKREQQKFENDIKLGELGVKVGNLDLARQKAAGAGGAKAVKLEDVPRSLDELRRMGVSIPDGVVLPADSPGLTLNQAENLSKTAKASEDWGRAARENSPEERNRQLAVGELVDDQGEPLQFRSAESAEKVATLKGSADFGVRLIDRLEAAYKKHGWSSDLVKSPEWQEAQADLNQYMLEKKNIDALGVLAGPDLDLIKGSMGKTDVTGLRDPGPGLRRGRLNIVDKLNSTIRAQSVLPKGRNAKRWEPTNYSVATPAEKTVVDELGEKLTSAFLEKPSKANPHNPMEIANEKISNALHGTQNKQTDEWLDQLSAFAELTNNQGDAAKQYLRTLADKAVDLDVRAQAKKILDSLPGAHVRTDEAR